MRVISFERRDGSSGIGVMTGDLHFVDANKRDAGLPDRLRALLARSDGLARLHKATAGQAADLAFSDVTLLPLIPDPHALWALALNFRTHIEETGLVTSKDYPQVFIAEHSKGRVVGLTLGHDAAAHDHAAYIQILRNSVLWCGRATN